MTITTITPVDPRDTQQLSDLARLFHGYCAHYNTKHTDSAIRRFLSARLLANESIAFLARTDDAAAGFVHLYPKFASTTLSRYWVLNDLFVDDAHRRKGIAGALMERAELFAQGTGSSVIVLKTHRTNSKAQKLYESRGWAVADDFLTYSLNLA